MIRGFLSDVLAKWKRFRWQGLVKVWAVFMACLLYTSLGVISDRTFTAQEASQLTYIHY